MSSRCAGAPGGGVGAYLESSKERNVPLYERFGFVVRNVLDFPKGGLCIWTMWRGRTSGRAKRGSGLAQPVRPACLPFAPRHRDAGVSCNVRTMSDPSDPDLSDVTHADAGPEAHFDLTLLGTFRLTADGEVVPLHEREQRVLALLAVRDRTMGRSALAGVLWPDASDANALGSLRSSLSQLPSSLRRQLMVSPQDLTLSAEVSVDLRRARILAQQLLALPPTLPKANSSQPALILLSSELLPDWYEEWAVEENREWHSMRALALEAWSVRLLALGRFSEAMQAALATIHAEPLGEGGYAALIQAHLAQGNRSTALKVLADYNDAIGAERDADPPAALKALFDTSEFRMTDRSTQSVLRRARTAVAGEETEAFEVIASGISMEPSIQHGDTLLVSRHVTPSAGRVIVAIHGGVWIVKRLALRDGELVLRSDNVDEEVPLSQVEVQGVVVQLHRNI